MCLNRARQRRRHRRTVEDWAHLWDHAANADACPDYQAWMAEHGWQWQLKGSDPQVLHIPFLIMISIVRLSDFPNRVHDNPI